MRGRDPLDAQQLRKRLREGAGRVGAAINGEGFSLPQDQRAMLAADALIESLVLEVATLQERLKKVEGAATDMAKYIVIESDSSGVWLRGQGTQTLVEVTRRFLSVFNDSPSEGTDTPERRCKHGNQLDECTACASEMGPYD